jgi:hypothetical protein
VAQAAPFWFLGSLGNQPFNQKSKIINQQFTSSRHPAPKDSFF